MIETQGSTAKASTLITQRDLVQALWITGFAALTAVGAQVEIPHYPVPYTLQTLFVLLSGAMLGKKGGAWSQLVYVAAGVAGLPVFAQFGFGPAKILGPSGGYLLSFPVAAFAVGYLLENNKTFLRALVAMTAGLFIVFTLGTIHLNFVFTHNMADAIKGGFLIFSWWDLAKLFTAAAIVSGYSALKRS